MQIGWYSRGPNSPVPQWKQMYTWTFPSDYEPTSSHLGGDHIRCVFECVCVHVCVYVAPNNTLSIRSVWEAPVKTQLLIFMVVLIYSASCRSTEEQRDWFS